MTNRWSIESFEEFIVANPVENFSSRKLQPAVDNPPVYQLSVSPTELVIPSNAVGTQSNWYPVAITNTGLSRVLLRNVTLTGGFVLRKRWENTYLEPEETTVFMVAIKPMHDMPYAGVLTVNTNQGISALVPMSYV